MSDDYRAQLAAELLEADRAAAAPYVTYPPSPWWYAPAIGAWLAVTLGVFAQWSKGSGVIVGVLLIALILVEIVFIRWIQQRHGAMPWPGRGTPPPEIRRVWRAYFAGALVVTAIVAVTWWWTGAVAALPETFVLVTAGLIWYEAAYRSAADAVKARLG